MTRFNYTISIIVPVYKVEAYLHRCVDSILAQTFIDFELILVDDGSPDNCPAICDKYAKKDERIKVIHKENGGLSSARNAGINIATGKYLLFCDSDDTVHPKWCEVMLDAIEKQPDAWNVCSLNRIIGDTVSVVGHSNITEHLSYFDIFKLGLSPYAVNKIYRKDILIENNILFDETCRFGEDIGFNIKYINFTKNIFLINIPLYNYYDNPLGIMGTYRFNLFELNLNHYTVRIPLIKTHELADFCDIYLYSFLGWLNNTMDPRNSMSFIQKMKYNNKMMNTPEFKHCVSNSSGKKDSKLFMRIIKLHNYYIYWAFQKICFFKDKLFNRKSGD